MTNFDCPHPFTVKIYFRVWNGGEGIANYNSSDDEERPGPEGREEGHMDVDQADRELLVS